jgi:hypothetical protein
MVMLDHTQTQPPEEDTYTLKVRFWYEAYREEEVGVGMGVGVNGGVVAAERGKGGGGGGERERGKEEVVAAGGGGGGGENDEDKKKKDAPVTTTPTTTTIPSSPSLIHASHSHLFRLYIQTEQNAGEYDIPPCNPHTHTDPSQCIHVLTSLNKASELFSPCSFQTNKDCADTDTLTQNNHTFKLLYAAGHLHVGGLSLELINADTGESICTNTPIYDEKTGLIEAIPPCVWGDREEEEEEEEGGVKAHTQTHTRMPRPPLLTAETRLLSIARYNSSGGGHLGVMASWQMRAAF